MCDKEVALLSSKPILKNKRQEGKTQDISMWCDDDEIGSRQLRRLILEHVRIQEKDNYAHEIFGAFLGVDNSMAYSAICITEFAVYV